MFFGVSCFFLGGLFNVVLLVWRSIKCFVWAFLLVLWDVLWFFDVF